MIQIEEKIIAYCVTCNRLEKGSGWTYEKVDESRPKPAGRMCPGCRPKMQ